MGIKALEYIIEKKHKEQSADLTDCSKRKELWLKSVKEFYQKIIKWLKPYSEKGLLKIDYVKSIKNEQYIGEYEIEEMILNISNEIVKLEPVGTFIVGAHGRIDMIGNDGISRFVLVDSESNRPRFRVRNGADYTMNGNNSKKRNDIPGETKFEWKISTSPPDIRYISLNEDSFSDSLIGVIHD